MAHPQVSRWASARPPMVYALVRRSWQVAVSPCWAWDFSANLSQCASTPTPVAPEMLLPVSSKSMRPLRLFLARVLPSDLVLSLVFFAPVFLRPTTGYCLVCRSRNTRCNTLPDPVLGISS